MRTLIAAIIVILGTTTARGETVTRYNILFLGKSGGSQTTRSSEGTFKVEYSYRDNGRGPDLKEDFALAEDGTLLRYVVKGTSTFGAAIDEKFTLTGGKAEWKSIADQGSTKLTGPAAYVPIECSSEMMARVVRAVAMKGGRINALPGGKLAVEKLLDEKVEV